jgi:hypothetical protein
MRTLLYLCYGNGPQVHETIFSILSALHITPCDRQDYRILVYTDSPAAFASLPVEIEALSARRLAEWLGPHNYNYRRKLMALTEAIERDPAPTVLVDSDTWFLRCPSELFRRVGPDRSCMHLAEGRLDLVNAPSFPRLLTSLQRAELLDRDGRPLSIPSSAVMWNSGVIGLDPAQAHLLREAVHLVDQVWRTFQDVPTIEQFAIAYFLQRDTWLQSTDDVIFHYWLDYLRKPFREVCPSLLARVESLPVAERARRAYRLRPQPSWLRRRKLAAKRRLWSMGLFRDRLQGSG